MKVKAKTVKMNKAKILQILRTHLLTILTVLAVVLSVVTGIIMRSNNSTYNARTVMYVNFLGDIFLRLIRVLIFPLIMSSLIAAIAPLDVSLSKKIGARAIVYILCTTVIAVILGVVLVVTIRPGGDGIDDGIDRVQSKASTITDTLLDLIR